jgi:hypothetical protein
MTPRRRLSPNEARSELNRDSPIPELGKATLIVVGKEMNGLGLPLLGDSGVVKDKAEPISLCLTVYPPTSALGSLPSVALSSGWAERI